MPQASSKPDKAERKRKFRAREGKNRRAMQNVIILLSFFPTTNLDFRRLILFE